MKGNFRGIQWVSNGKSMVRTNPTPKVCVCHQNADESYFFFKKLDIFLSGSVRGPHSGSRLISAISLATSRQWSAAEYKQKEPASVVTTTQANGGQRATLVPSSPTTATTSRELLPPSAFPSGGSCLDLTTNDVDNNTPPAIHVNHCNSRSVEAGSAAGHYARPRRTGWKHLWVSAGR